MAAHAIGYDPDILVPMQQNRIFILGANATGIGNAMAMNLEIDRGLLVVNSGIA